MKLCVMSVYDKAVMAFMPPFYSRTKPEGIRMFAEACGKEDSAFFKHALDYTLMFLGVFDDADGSFEQADTGPLRLLGAMECVTQSIDLKAPDAGVLVSKDMRKM